MNICIIDDEYDNREILSFIIKNQKGDYNIVGEASNNRFGKQRPSY